jgi:hypothetical protein
VNADQRPDSERVEALQKENQMLRKQLIEVQTKMSRMLASVQMLSDSVSKTLDNTAAGGDLDERDGDGEDLRLVDDPGRKQSQQLYVSDSSLTSLDLESFDPSMLDFDTSFAPTNIAGQCQNTHCYLCKANVYIYTAPVSGSGLTSEVVNVAGTNPFYSQIPNIWSHEYQMGMQPYLNAINATAESSLVLGKDYSFTNSPFSDHIQLLRRMLKDKLNTLGFVPNAHNPVQR